MGILKESGNVIEIVNDLSTPVDDWIFEKTFKKDIRKYSIAIGFIRGTEFSCLRWLAHDTGA